MLAAKKPLTCTVLGRLPTLTPSFERPSPLQVPHIPTQADIAWWIQIVGFRAEARLTKAALMYADEVVVASSSLVLAAAAPAGTQGITDPAAALRLAAENLRELLQLAHRDDEVGRQMTADTDAVLRAMEDLATATTAGVLRLPPIPATDGDVRESVEFVLSHALAAVVDPTRIPFPDPNDPKLQALFLEATPTAGRRAAEGALTAALFGSLPAFPDAPMDVILDVRSQLAGARTAFRGAIATSARDLDDGVRAGEPLAALIAELRRREVEPALAQLDTALQELGALDALLRAADIKTVSALLAIAAASTSGLAGVSGMVAGMLAPAPLLAAAAREIAHQRRHRRELAATPYWLLHESDRLTRSV